MATFSGSCGTSSPGGAATLDATISRELIVASGAHRYFGGHSRPRRPAIRGQHTARWLDRVAPQSHTLVRPSSASFLYFASEGAQQRCLILDARVARSLFDLGWSIAPTYPTKTFSYNWYTDTYVSYCELLSRWAEVAGTADMFERALFDAGRS